MPHDDPRIAASLARTPGERIEAAAIQIGEAVCLAPKPGRHHDVIRAVHRAFGMDPVTGMQGFVTSTGRFVERAEAAQIAVAAGQILPVQNGGQTATRTEIDRLFSEDVW